MENLKELEADYIAIKSFMDSNDAQLNIRMYYTNVDEVLPQADDYSTMELSNLLIDEKGNLIHRNNHKLYLSDMFTKYREREKTPNEVEMSLKINDSRVLMVGMDGPSTLILNMHTDIETADLSAALSTEKEKPWISHLPLECFTDIVV